MEMGATFFLPAVAAGVVFGAGVDVGADAAGTIGSRSVGSREALMRPFAGVAIRDRRFVAGGGGFGSAES